METIHWRFKHKTEDSHQTLFCLILIYFVSPSENVTIKVPENGTVGSLVIQVRATDQDIGINGAVRYRILKDTLGHWQTFTIDQTTGAILLQKPLDRERQKLYEV
ncbi:hypothetical protein O3P69_017367 [Scylla paramamosain]|uniref:Cadherin domain-containing protein n=1 Tax=Scylla paramamosain TaxID=85552 RepID=A0AAW0S9Z6_SCYPA